MPVRAAMRAAFPILAAIACGPVAGQSGDDRNHGHLRYAEVANADRAAITQTLSPDKSCELHRDAAVALYRLTDAARAAGVPLRMISCFRTVGHQQSLFCDAGADGACRDPATRARSVAPGGYSEHNTGYALDFGTDGCDLAPCMAATPGGRWLTTKAPKFGFELSFPAGNRQGVMWEPWHWRWVGIDPADPGTARSRRVFADARARFPALPTATDRATPPTVTLKPVDPNRFIGPRD